MRRRPPQRSEDEKSITASAVITPHPARPKTNPLKTLQKLLCAVGVVTTRREPQSGRISALAGREGRLRACTPEPKAAPSTATMESSYNIRHSKTMHYPGRWPGWGGAFQWWGGAPGRQTGAGFMMDFFLNAVTNVLLRSGPVAKRWELSLMLPNRRDRQVAARAGILRSLSTGQAMNRLWVYRIY